jgi:hypothetical protein
VLVARMLMMQAAEAQPLNKQRRSPLHMVCLLDSCSAADRPSLARSLLKAGADPGASDVFGCTPLAYAKTSGG